MSQALWILHGLIAQNLSSGGLSTIGIQQTVVMSSGLAALSLSVDNVTLAREITSRVLQVMDGLVEGAGSVLLGQAEALISSVSLLANSSAGLNAPQQDMALSVLERTTHAVETTSASMHEEAIMALSSLVGAGVLENEGCYEKRVDRKVDGVMDNLASLAAGSLNPADRGYIYEDNNLGTSTGVNEWRTSIGSLRRGLKKSFEMWSLTTRLGLAFRHGCPCRRGVVQRASELQRRGPDSHHHPTRSDGGGKAHVSQPCRNTFDS
jgi:hypothetical protein